MWPQYQNHIIGVVISLLSLLIGRLSVSTPNHQQECAPEIEALESCGRQVSLLEQQQTQAEGRGLERCVERERESCELRIRATEDAASHLDCIICRQRCPDGSIP
ncbi:MAG: hypothetical protein CMM54_00025 [Rhodospirillaceae bacterium]|nr:hypothetical protein [Rhodospirillaceae bacterium]